MQNCPFHGPNSCPDYCYLRIAIPNPNREQVSRCLNHFSSTEITSVLLLGETEENRELLLEHLYKEALEWQTNPMERVKRLKRFHDEGEEVKRLSDLENLVEGCQARMKEVQQLNTDLKEKLKESEARNFVLIGRLKENGGVIQNLMEQLNSLKEAGNSSLVSKTPTDTPRTQPESGKNKSGPVPVNSSSPSSSPSQTAY